jgi:ankyrin repeat protein
MERAILGGWDSVRFMIDAGYDLSTASPALIETAAEQRFGSLEMVRLLLDHGLEIDWSSRWAAGALFHSVRRVNLDLFDELIARGADPRALTRGLETLLFAPSDWGADPRWRDRLLDLDIDVNHRDSSQRTALMTHATHLNFATVAALLDAGADPTTTDKEGKTIRERLAEQRRVTARHHAEYAAETGRMIDILDEANHSAGSPTRQSDGG